MTASTGFRELVRELSPPWLSRFWGERLLYAPGLIVDAVFDWCVDGMVARFPIASPPDGLPLLGKDRALPRGVGEPDTGYRERLRLAPSSWVVWGSAWGMLEQFDALFYGLGMPFWTVDNGGTWHHWVNGAADVKYAKQDNWNWDGSTSEWSRAWVLVYPDGNFADDGTWGDPGIWGDGGTWGSTLTVGQIEAMRTIVTDRKPAGTRVVGILLVFDDMLFEPEGASVPDGNWGSFGKLNGTHYERAREESVGYVMGSKYGVC